MSEKNRAIVSMLLKLALIISTTVGVVLCSTSAMMTPQMNMLFFTTQSNIWIAVADLVLLIMQLHALKGGKCYLSHNAYLVQQVFTVSITLTGFVYCFVLAPVFIMGQGPVDTFNPFALPTLLVHVVTPVLAIVDFIGFTRHGEFAKKDCLWSVLPPLYYIGFSLIGYFKHWNFGMGNNYPYFFLNYGSPAGLFGFSNQMPYFMGSFYWILILAAFVVAVSYFYIFIVNKLTAKYNKKI